MRTAPAQPLGLLRKIGIIMAIVGTLGAAWIPAIDLTVLAVVPVAQSIAPLLVLVAGLAVVLLAPGRRVILAGLVVLLVGLSTWLIHPKPVPTVPPCVSGPQNRCATIFATNAFFGRAEPAHIISQATSVDADVVIVSEATPDLVTALTAAGLTEPGWQRHGTAAAGSAGTVIFYRGTGTTQPALNRALPQLSFHHPQIAWGPATTPVTVVGVHSVPPLPALATEWRDSLTGYAQYLQTHSGPVVLAGDFNASSAHPGFRRLLAHSTDGVNAGHWPGYTWATKRGVLFTRIDHVLVKNATVHRGGALPITGSDHKAVWAQISWG